MKKLFAIPLIVLFLGFLFSCTSQKQNISQLEKEWHLVSFKNYTKDNLMKAKANMDLSPAKTNPGQFGAYMGCNRMFFNAKFNPNGTVKFSDVGSTMMYCDKWMDLETQFAKELPQITKYKIEGHYLILSAENGSTMKFLASDWD